MAQLEFVKNTSLKKLEAYTLFETVISITIIAILIGLGTLIYTNIITAENPIAYYQAEEHVKEKLHELKQSKAFFNQNFEYENYTIQQEIVPHKGNQRLYAVTFTVFVGKNELLQRKHLVVNE